MCFPGLWDVPAAGFSHSGTGALEERCPRAHRWHFSRLEPSEQTDGAHGLQSPSAARPAPQSPAPLRPAPTEPRPVRARSGDPHTRLSPGRGPPNRPAARGTALPSSHSTTHLTLAATDDMASFLSVFLLDTAVPIFARGMTAGGALIARARGRPCRGGAGCRAAPCAQRPAMPPRCPRRVRRSAAAAACSLTAAGGRAGARPAAQEAPLYLAAGSLLHPRLLTSWRAARGARAPLR